MKLSAVFLSILMLGHLALADSATLGWWFLPDSIEDLPLELEEDDNGNWMDLWMRPSIDSKVSPNEVMEQSLGAKWVGLNPNKDGNPTQVSLVFGNKVVDFNGDVERVGTVEQNKIQWSDNTAESLFAFRKHRRGRRRRSAKIKFGAIVLPPLASKTKTVSPWAVERLPEFLSKVAQGPGANFETRDLSALAQVYDADGSFLNLKYDSNCSPEARAKIEDALANEVEPRLTCFMSQSEGAQPQILAALLQRPMLSCKPQVPMTQEDCGMATVPHISGFFVGDPRINVAMDRCKGELPTTLLHEALHLGGVKEKDMDSALEMAESCASSPAELEYANENEGFFNDFEVQTRIFLFRKVRDESVDKWHWREGERDFMLGTICLKMGDKYCAKNYFQKAAEAGGLQGTITLPEGGTVTWAALAQFMFYDSVSEDLQRMHELSRYLKRDPNGTLLRRIETGTHRLHEFFVARQALEAVKNNKGVCSSETDEHVLCEDLVEIYKTPWFKHP